MRPHGSKETLQDFLGDLAWEGQAAVDVVAPPDHRIGDRAIVGVGEKVIEHAERKEAPADRSRTTTQLALPFDEAIHIMDRDCFWSNVDRPSKEDRDIARVVERGTGAGFASTPIPSKLINVRLWKHRSPHCTE
jgi:hypothetical protein